MSIIEPDRGRLMSNNCMCFIGGGVACLFISPLLESLGVGSISLSLSLRKSATDTPSSFLLRDLLGEGDLIQQQTKVSANRFLSSGNRETNILMRVGVEIGASEADLLANDIFSRIDRVGDCG
jgi:hypothetical protein